MSATKPWYLSKTVWAAIITIASALASLLGLPLAGIDAQGAAEQILNAITALSGVAALAGRFTATTKLH